MSHDTSLRALAERLGILSSYLSQDGSQLRSTSDETRVAILAAMGYDASSEARARALLAEWSERAAERVAEPVRVVRERELREAEPGGLRFRVPESWGVRAGEKVEYALAIGVSTRDGAAVAGESGVFAVALTPPPTPGYYELRITISARGRRSDARQRLIVVPERCVTPERRGVVPERCVTPERRGFGIIANLYSIRGARSWGVGDLTDLAELARWSGSRGAEFVGVNPLHALRTIGGEVSPYSPVSRLYRNPAYLDVEAIPELAGCDEARSILSRESVQADLRRLRASDRVEYERRARLARPILEALHRCFVSRRAIISSASQPEADGRNRTAADYPDGTAADYPNGTAADYPNGADADYPNGADAEHRNRAESEHRNRADAEPHDRTDAEHRNHAYEAYLKREGPALERFATFTALDEHFARDSGRPLPWQQWPTEYRTPDSQAVAAFARSHPMEVDFHRWIQFELDRQLGDAAAAGAGAGLAIGLYQDLAVASAPFGSDVWASPLIHASGVSIGAPPDNYSATGQNWGLTPLDPHRLFDDGYRFWTALVRSALRHAGAIRIDHILGLFRQFWIPDGMSGTMGAYVRFPTHDLMGILALESALHQAVIVGEDLGTVPPEVPGILREWGILGTRVMLFERERDGTFRPAASYEPLSLTTADTHDLPTLAGFWEGRDISLAAKLGRLEDADAESAALRTRQNDRRLLADRLIADGALKMDEASASTGSTPGSSEASPASVGKPDSLPDATGIVNAVHRFLCSTPAVLVGISLDDLAGEVEPVNIPGITAEHFASWTRRMRTPLPELIRGQTLDCERTRP
ncbi:MAG TPA: 4-alpha-glucanotransferase [Gemmatimonadaceae bacterium]